MTDAGRGTAGPRPHEVWEQVLDELRFRIIEGELAPGVRLVETELAHEFGVSRGPIRTALLNLEQSGLVHSSHRRGVEVARFTPDDIAELYQVRTALEALAVREAAARSTPALVARLQAHIDALATLNSDGAAAVDAAEADLAFHEELCAASDNRLLLVTWMNLADQLAVVIARAHQRAGAPAATSGAHQAILDAVAAKDPDRAEAALRAHLFDASAHSQAHGDGHAARVAT